MIEYVEMTVICHTENCFNDGISIVIDCALPECIVFCGVCNQEITDKTQTTPEPLA